MIPATSIMASSVATLSSRFHFYGNWAWQFILSLPKDHSLLHSEHYSAKLYFAAGRKIKQYKKNNSNS